MAQAQITKTAGKTNKAAVKTAAAPAKRATRKAPAAKAVAAEVPAEKINFVIQDYARPVAGSRLAAFTATWLDLSGLAKGDAVKRADLVKVAGPRAIAYHTSNGNMESTPDGVKLTDKGFAAFASRTVDPEAAKAYRAALVDGTQSDMVSKDAAAYVKA